MLQVGTCNADESTLVAWGDQERGIMAKQLIDWHAHVHAYVVERLRRGTWAPNTAKTNRSVLQLLADHLAGRPMTKRRVEAWALDANLSPSYRRNRVSIVRGFAAWLIDRRIIGKDPTRDMEQVKQPKGLPRFLQSSEVAAVMAACPDLRAQVVVSLMVQEGLRRAEVAAVLVEDIDPDRGTIAVRGKGGRGERTRLLPLTPATAALVRRHLAETRAVVGCHLVRSYRTGEGLTPNSLGVLVAEIMRTAGVKAGPGDGRSAHALRHTCAQHVLDGGADIVQVQAILGHSSIQTTQLYLRGQVSGLAIALGGRDYRAPIPLGG